MRKVSSYRYRWIVCLLLVTGVSTVFFSSFRATAEDARAFRHSLASSSLPVPTPTPSPKIVYTKSEGASQSWSIFIANSDGSGEEHLTVGNNDTQPAISRDGQKVAFARGGSSGNYDIYVVNSTGGVPQRVTNSTNDEMEPAWSPTGDRLAYVKGTDSTFLQDACDLGCSHRADIYVRANDGTDTRLTNSGLNTDPTWSPDGAWIAFSRRPTPTDNPDIYKVNVTSRTLAQLTSGSEDEGEPAWSPNDMQLLAYTSDYFRPGEVPVVLGGKMPIGNVTAEPSVRAIPTIKLLNPDNNNGGRIGSTITNACEPAWSADGKQITYTFIIKDEPCLTEPYTNCNGWPALGVLDVTGTVMTRLPTVIRRTNGVWSPSRVGN